VKARPAGLHRRKATSVTFTILDAGDPVPGAKVQAGTHSASTDGQGRATLKLTGHGSSLAVRASAPNYSIATRLIKVVR
jgi:hypothetical protein